MKMHRHFNTCSKSFSSFVIASLLLGFSYFNLMLAGSRNCHKLNSISELGKISVILQQSSDEDFLLGPKEYGTNDCPPLCGCVETPYDCPRWYDFSSVQESSMRVDSTHKSMLTKVKMKRFDECLPGKTTSTGGWCLVPAPSGVSIDLLNHSIQLPDQHVVASPQVLKTLLEFIEVEELNSISDFGAGVGQYKAGVLQKYPYIEYLAYDGAGNIENYTKGFVSFFDLTIPLTFPITDWVMSLAVGEHVPSRFEGMVMRNLHRHNRKGIILMWGTLGMQGFKHINNHSLEYIIYVFQKLGYEVDEVWTEKFRGQENNYDWFIKGTLVFRRSHNNTHIQK